MQCERHPDTETYATCVRCGTPICYRCQVSTPVGLRCQDCGKSVPLPTHAVSPGLYLRAAVTSVLVGLVGGLLLRFLVPNLILIPFLRILVMGALGYMVGEGVSWATQGGRGRGLQMIAGAGVVLAVSLGLGDVALSLYGIVGFIVAVVVAGSRLR